MLILQILLYSEDLSVRSITQVLRRGDDPNIARACASMREAHLITEAGRKVSHKKGRPEIHYQISGLGVKFIVQNSLNPQMFWSVVLGASYNSELAFNWNQILDLYNVFIKKYLSYSTDHSCTFQLDSFNLCIKEWLDNLILKTSNVSIGQKILEVLALKPELDLKGLSEATSENEDILKKTLRDYSMIPHGTSLVNIDGKFEGQQYDESDWRFHMHNAITVRKHKSDSKIYRLSLFGILIVLTLLRLKDTGKLSLKLFYNKLSFQEYLTKVARMYTSKLPLIFGNWKFLNQVLDVLSCYNFDIIVDKEFREIVMSTSIVEGGSKEIYDSMIGMTAYTKNQLIELRNVGLKSIVDFQIWLQRSPNNLAIESQTTIMQSPLGILTYINGILDPLKYDVNSFLSLVKQLDAFPSEIARSVSYFYDNYYWEDSLAAEISFMYCLNLMRDYQYESINIGVYLNELRKKNPSHLNAIPPPILALQVILKERTDISSFFTIWMKDIRHYHRQIEDKIGHVYDKLRVSTT